MASVSIGARMLKLQAHPGQIANKSRNRFILGQFLQELGDTHTNGLHLYNRWHPHLSTDRSGSKIRVLLRFGSLKLIDDWFYVAFLAWQFCQEKQEMQMAPLPDLNFKFSQCLLEVIEDGRTDVGLPNWLSLLNHNCF